MIADLKSSDDCKASGLPWLGNVMQILLKDDTQVYKQFVKNESFRRYVGDLVCQPSSEHDHHAPPFPQLHQEQP